MIYLPYFLLMGLGYIVGYYIRQIFAQLQWGKSSCNIQKKGILVRGVGGILVFGVAIYFQIPALMLIVGFMWYESRSRWCIVRSFQS